MMRNHKHQKTTPQLEKPILATIMQNSTSHWQTQTFSNEIMFTKDQNVGTLAIPQDIEILGWCPAGPVLISLLTFLHKGREQISIFLQLQYEIPLLVYAQLVRRVIPPLFQINPHFSKITPFQKSKMSPPFIGLSGKQK